MDRKRVTVRKKYDAGGNATVGAAVNGNPVQTMPPAMPALMSPGYYLGGNYDMTSDFARAGNFAQDIGAYRDAWNTAVQERRDALEIAQNTTDAAALAEANRRLEAANRQLASSRLGIAGSTMGTASSLVAGVAEGARGLTSAYAGWKMNGALERNMRDNLRRQMIGGYQSLSNGGEISHSGFGIRDSGMPGLGGFTGEYVFGLPENMTDRATAELEKGEYLQTPDGSVMEVAGEKHSKGGTPVDTEGFVVSDRLKVGGEQAKYLRDTYGLHVKASDSFAAVLDKYKAQTGLKKAYDTQSGYLNMLEKNGDVKDRATAGLNRQYLSGKISDAQKEIDGLTPAFETFTKEVYHMQEGSKFKSQDSKFKDAGIRDGLFGDGGMIDRGAFDALRKVYGLTEKEALDTVMRNLSAFQAAAGPDGAGPAYEAGKGGYVRRYDKGGRTEPVPNRYRGQYMKNGRYDIGRQSRNAGDLYGDVTEEEAQMRLEEEVRLHPRLLSSGILKIDGSGNIVFAEGKTVGDMQDYYNRTFDAVGRTKDMDMGQDEWDLFRYNNAFTPETADINASERDRKYGNYTSTIGTVRKNILKPGELRRLNDAGLTHFSQLDSGAARTVLGNERADRILNGYREDGQIDENLDFMLGERAFETPLLSGPGSRLKMTVTQPEAGKIGEQILADAKRRDEEKRSHVDPAPAQPRGGFYDAEWFELPPSRLQMPSLRQVAFNRVSPNLTSLVNPALASAEVNAGYQLGDMPDSQRGAVASYMLGESQEAANRYFAQASAQNAAQQQQADVYNAQAGDRETMTNTQLGQQYEMLAQKAIENTYNDWANYLGEMGLRGAQRRQNGRSFNLMNSMFANYRLNGDGRLGMDNAVQYGNPYSGFKI
jgi:hypothetical protein